MFGVCLAMYRPTLHVLHLKPFYRKICTDIIFLISQYYEFFIH